MSTLFLRSGFSLVRNSGKCILSFLTVIIRNHNLQFSLYSSMILQSLTLPILPPDVLTNTRYRIVSTTNVPTKEKEKKNLHL